MPATDAQHVAVVLAAGASTRTGAPKALAELDGETFIARTIRTLREGGCTGIVVVLAAPHAQAIADALRLAHPPGGAQIRRVDNPHPELGMLSSVRVGLLDALSVFPSARSVVVSLVDHPRVRVETLRALIAERQTTGARALRPVVQGRGGHPIVLGRRCAEQVARSEAPTLREALGSVDDLEVDDDAVLDDADTREAVAALGGKLPDRNR